MEEIDEIKAPMNSKVLLYILMGFVVGFMMGAIFSRCKNITMFSNNGCNNTDNSVVETAEAGISRNKKKKTVTEPTEDNV